MTELRDYQVAAVEKLETAINLGQCPLSVLPTAGRIEGESAGAGCPQRHRW
jgi:hypothetical protein